MLSLCPLQHTSCVAMGDPVKIIERETTHAVSFSQPTACRSVAAFAFPSRDSVYVLYKEMSDSGKNHGWSHPSHLFSHISILTACFDLGSQEYMKYYITVHLKALRRIYPHANVKMICVLNSGFLY